MKHDFLDSLWQLKAGLVETMKGPKTNPARNDEIQRGVVPPSEGGIPAPEGGNSSPPKKRKGNKLSRMGRRKIRSSTNKQKDLDQQLQQEPPNDNGLPLPEAEPTEGKDIPEVRTRSGQLVRLVQRFIEVMKAEICAHTSEIPGEIFCLQAMFPEEPEPLNPYPLLYYIMLQGPC